MNWTVSTENLPGISLHQKTDEYKWSEYSDDNATNLYYKFFQDSLCRVDILVLDSEQATKMQEILESKFGEGEINPDESIKWVADGITITTFNYLKGRGFAFTHNETLKAKEEYANNIKSPQKKLALKEKRKKEAKSTSDSDGSKKTTRRDKVEDSLKRIAGDRPQEPGREKFSDKSRMSKTREQSSASGAGRCSSDCYTERTQCLYHCGQTRNGKLGSRKKMYKGHVEDCSYVCYDAYGDCIERCNY